MSRFLQEMFGGSNTRSQGIWKTRVNHHLVVYIFFQDDSEQEFSQKKHANKHLSDEKTRVVFRPFIWGL